MNRMSKKKKNIRRKKSNNLLKGMAAAGAVVGGGTIFAGNNAVYAAENEQGVIGSQSEEQIIESQSVSESTTESLSQVKSETSSYENEGAVETSAVEGNTVQTNQENGFAKRVASFFNDEKNIMTVDETENEKAVSENDAEIESASLSVSGSISKVGSQISSESISGSEAESEMVSESLSTSTSTLDFESESRSISTSASLSTSMETSTYTSESESLSEQFNSTSLKFDSELNETLEDLIIQINASKAKLEAIRQEAKNSDKTLGTDYRDEADNLAVLLAKYSFFQKYGVGKIDNSSYQYNNHAPGNNAKRNNFFVKYENKDKSESHVGYFDWVGVTEKKDANGNVKYEFVEYDKADPNDVVQIAVVKKAPIYSNSTTKFYFYEDKDGNITGYIAKCYYMFGHPVDWFGDYEKMDSFNKDNIKYDTGDEIQFTYNGETYTLTVHKDLSLDPKEYPDETFPNFGKVPDDLNIDKENTTIKGNYFWLN